eukprot:TRINITY_DN17391_c0_g1_i1.p1 TRINITY_DN17391_c0_g1~~TRINITY_DN17391_c0_g1_i1.p1  ORF type:complete len:119 (-),score=25.37 TRINITY_DN17391_c0_g1_i1:32-388(-)
MCRIFTLLVYTCGSCFLIYYKYNRAYYPLYARITPDEVWNSYMYIIVSLAVHLPIMLLTNYLLRRIYGMSPMVCAQQVFSRLPVSFCSSVNIAVVYSFMALSTHHQVLAYVMKMISPS